MGHLGSLVRQLRRIMSSVAVYASEYKIQGGFVFSVFQRRSVALIFTGIRNLLLKPTRQTLSRFFTKPELTVELWRGKFASKSEWSVEI